MNKILLSAVFLLPILSFSQIKALTENGTEVVLLEDGTWRLADESEPALFEQIKTNPAVFAKTAESSFLLNSTKVPAGVYLNSKNWNVNSKPAMPHVEYIFTSIVADSQVAGFFLTEKVEIATLKNLLDITLISIKKNVDYFRLKETEYRTVNGLKMLYARYTANIKGMDFEYAAYYYLMHDGYASVTVFAPQKKFEAHFPEMQKLLNGLSTAEIKTFTPPPLPASARK